MRVPVVGAALIAAVACAKPTAPVLTPESATVTRVSPTGLGVDLVLLATNSNSVDLVARDVRAHVVLDKDIEVGTATVAERVVLPSNQSTLLTVALSIPWTDLVPLLALELDSRLSVPYSIDGKLTLGGDLLAVEIPFQLEGSVARDQIVRATMSAITAIPGTTGPINSASTPSAPSRRRAH
jgi:LEA14-like dessication related protein